MSISSTARKAGPYNGNGITVAFPFAFKVFSAADVLVVKTTPAAAESTLVLTTDYTVSLNADQDSNPGGTVTAVSAPASGYKVTISSQVDELQPVVLTNAGGFYPKVINDALDRLTILTQQLSEKVARALKVNISSTVSPDDIVNDLQNASAEAVAAADSAAASAASIPSMTGGADTVIVINPTNNGWLYKTDSQLLTWLGGNAANGPLVLDGSGNLPALNGSALTGISTTPANGSITAVKIAGGTGTGNLTQYTSAVTPLPSAGGSAAVAHSLGVVPSEAVLEFTCLTADNGYAVGDVIQMPLSWNGSTPLSTPPVWKNTTQIGFNLFAAYTFCCANKGTAALAALTLASWSYRFRLRAA